MTASLLVASYRLVFFHLAIVVLVTRRKEPVHYYFSAGVSGSGEAGSKTLEGDTIIAVADRRLYAAKEAGWNRVYFEG